MTARGIATARRFAALAQEVGIPPVAWLTSSSWSLVSSSITYVWHQVGFAFVIFLGGLANISQDILDAADVDGAHGWRRLWSITLPMLSPTLLFAAVIAVISALQIFAEPQIMTRGGPGDSSRTLVMMIYESAFQNLEIGYSAAIASAAVHHDSVRHRGAVRAQPALGVLSVGAADLPRNAGEVYPPGRRRHARLKGIIMSGIKG